MPSDPIQGAVATLRAFVEANARKDDDAMKACLTRDTLESGNFSGSTPPGVEFRMGDPETADGRVIIPLNVISTEAPPDAPPLDTLRCVMVEEDGEWKFDLLATMQPMMQLADQAMREAMEQIGDAMSEALGAVGQAMSSAFGDSDSSADVATSAFTGEALTLSTWEDAPDLPTDAEWIPLPELLTLPTVSGELREAIGRDVPVTVDLQGLLDLFGSTDSETLIPWLDTQFPSGLVAAIELASRAVPTEFPRLRRVRIEPAYEWMDRALTLDGPDLVYRVDLRNTDGWYDADQLAQLILGVLAGLPENAEQYPATMGDLPAREPLPTFDTIQDLRTPREMKRISRILGGVVGLDVDWQGLWDGNQMVRNWCIWTLPRIVGALRLAYPVGGEPVPEGLIRVIRIGIGYGNAEASLEGGVLALTLTPTRGEQGCLYEQQLCDVILGRPIPPPTDTDPGTGASNDTQATPDSPG